MIRVLLADDEPLTRARIRTVLAADPEFTVVAEAANGREAVELAAAHRPDVALLDIVMPVLDGLAAAEEITRTVPGTGVLSRLHVVEGTVKVFVTSILRRLAVANRVQAAIVAYEAGLV